MPMQLIVLVGLSMGESWSEPAIDAGTKSVLSHVYRTIRHNNRPRAYFASSSAR